MTKISELTKANVLDGTEVIPAVKAGTTVSVTVAQMQTDATARARAKASVQRLSIISGAEQSFVLGRAIATAGNRETARILHKNLTGKTVTGLRSLAAMYGSATTSGVGTTSGVKERQNSSATVHRVSFEINGTTTDETTHRTPVTWGGSLDVTFTPVAGPYTFPLAALSDNTQGTVVAAGATFYERASVTVTTNGNVFYGGLTLRGGTTGYGTNTGEGTASNSAAERVYDNSDNTAASAQMQAIANSSSPYWGSSAVLGYCTDGSVAPSLAIFGDSIATGTDDAAYGNFTGGWVLRLFANVPHMLLTFPGERGTDAADLRNSECRYWLSQYATHVLWQYGRNDLSYWMGIQVQTVQQYLATMQAVTLKAAKLFMFPRGNGYPGQPFIACTTLPAPSSTDGYLTMANQSKETYEAGRLALNQWLRDTSVNGFVAQANNLVSGVVGAGNARVLDPCKGFEANSAGTFAIDGGFIPSSNVLATGTSTGTNTATIFNDTTKAWTPNAFKGKQLYIVSGLGAGQSFSIGYNTATQLAVRGFTTIPDNTSVYRITDAFGMAGVHPGTGGSIAISNALANDALTVMQPLP